MTETTKKGQARKAPEVSTQPHSLIQIDLPQKVYLIVIALLMVPYFILAGFLLARPHGKKEGAASPATSSAQSTASAEANASHARPGPWGDLEYVRMFLEIPEEFLSVRADETADRRWFFGGKTREDAATFLNQLGLSPETQSLLQSAKWDVSAKGAFLTPPREVVLNLGPAARQRLYVFLAQFPENTWQREAFVFPADSFEEFFANSGLSRQTIDLVRQLCYPHKKVLLFSDMPWVLDTLKTYDEKLRLEKAASRRTTLLVKLRVKDDSNIDALLSYWGRAGMDKDLRPLLESVHTLPGEVMVGVNNLLPAFPRSRLYRFPFPSLNQPENCHWTSFNFFKEKPEGKFDQPDELRKKIESEYYPVFSDPKYRDVVFLNKPNGEIVHSAVFIADDIVYTKNGGHFTAPWLLMRIPDLLDSYSAFVPPDQPLQVVYYRNKYY